MLRITHARGFTLIEALLASVIAATAVVGVVHLVALAADQTLASRRATAARALAQGKLEELRSLSWTYDDAGAPVSSPSLATSPPDALLTDRDGYVEALDRFGAIAASDEVPYFLRRWAIARLEAHDPDTLVLQVCVFRWTGGETAAAEACVWTIRVRRP